MVSPFPTSQLSLSFNLIVFRRYSEYPTTIDSLLFFRDFFRINFLRGTTLFKDEGFGESGISFNFHSTLLCYQSNLGKNHEFA